MYIELVLNKWPKLETWKEVHYNNLHNDSNVDIAIRETCNEEMKIPVTAELLQELQSSGISNTNLQVNQTLPGPKLSIGFKMDTLTDKSIEGYVGVEHMDTFIAAFTNDPGFLVKLEVTVASITAYNDPIYDEYDDKEVSYIRDPVPVKLTLTPRQKRYCFNLKRGETGPSQLKHFKAKIHTRGVGDSFDDLWDNNECHHHVWLSLALMFDPVDGVDPDQDIPDPLAFTRKMLADGLLANVTIIAGNGAEIKCHRSVLAAHSPVIHTMFQPEKGMTEAQTGIMKMEHLSEDSVRGLLEYLYVWKSSVAHESPSVCIDLLEAGHQYDIKPLGKCMEKILLRKTEDWFTGDSLLRLILYLKNRDLEELKTRTKNLFESKYGDVEKLAAFKALLTKNLGDVTEVMDLISTPAAVSE